MIDLAQTAENMFADIIREHTDIDDIREAISERSHDAADSACIYYHACEEIISRYETDSRADTDTADDCGYTFKPSEYLNAMQAYAFSIARSIIECEAHTLADDLESALDDITNAVFANSARQHITTNDIRLSADCPHGWAAHNREDDSGVCYWLSRQLDGCNAVAMPVAGVWLSYTWE